MTQLEKEIEKKLRNTVAKFGGQCLKWVCPGWSGVPDRIILLPGGRVIFAELKRPKGGVVSPMQTYWRRRLEGLGFTVWHIYNERDVNEAALAIRLMLGETKPKRETTTKAKHTCANCAHENKHPDEEPCFNCSDYYNWEE